MPGWIIGAGTHEMVIVATQSPVLSLWSYSTLTLLFAGVTSLT